MDNARRAVGGLALVVVAAVAVSPVVMPAPSHEWGDVMLTRISLGFATRDDRVALRSPVHAPLTTSVRWDRVQRDVDRDDRLVAEAGAGTTAVTDTR